MLARLSNNGALRVPRARLFCGGALPGLRTALLLDFGGARLGTGALAGDRGLWLVEDTRGIVSAFACWRAPDPLAVGGRVIHEIPVLDPTGAWLDALAALLANAVVGGRETSAHAALLTRIERALLEAALRAFCAELDAEALAAVQAEGAETVAAYNHYVGGRGHQPRNRKQAAVTHPPFAALLRQDWRLRRTVAEGAPLIEALAARFSVRPGTVQRARALPPACFSPEGLASALKRIDRLPAHAVPNTEADWAVLRRLHDPLEALAETTASDLARFLKPFASGWQAGLAAIEAKLQGPLDIDAIYEMMHCAYRSMAFARRC